MKKFAQIQLLIVAFRSAWNCAMSHYKGVDGDCNQPASACLIKLVSPGDSGFEQFDRFHDLNSLRFGRIKSLE